MSSCVRAVGSWGRGPQRRGEHRSDNGPDDDERNDATPSSGQCSSDQVKHRIDRWIVERGSPGRSTSSGPEAYDGGMRCTIALTADAIVVSSISPRGVAANTTTVALSAPAPVRVKSMREPLASTSAPCTERESSGSPGTGVASIVVVNPDGAVVPSHATTTSLISARTSLGGSPTTQATWWGLREAFPGVAQPSVSSPAG